MALYQDGEIDLLALGGGRELDHLPWHFAVVKMDKSVGTKSARHWIWKNLTSRFTVIGIADLRQAGGGQRVAAFEDPAEATAFMLSQPLMVDLHSDF
jgi:hypothetical protein